LTADTPQIFVIIINYNSGDLLARCLTQLEQQSLLPTGVIIVDNNSSDDSLDISSQVLELKIVRLQYNSGFARGNNIALQQIDTADFVALLNPDAFPDPNWLEQLSIAAVTHPDYASFASQMVMDDDSRLLDGQGDEYHLSGLVWRKHHAQSLDKGYQVQRPVFSACAGAALYRYQDMLQAGGFDEDYFCYLEDIDLGFRLQLMGKPCLYVHTAIVHHIGSAITGRRSDFSLYYGHRNLIWAFAKNMPAPLLLLCLPLHLLLNLFTLFYFSLKGHGRIIFKAKWDGARQMIPLWHKRKTVQQTRKVSSHYIYTQLNKFPFTKR